MIHSDKLMSLPEGFKVVGAFPYMSGDQIKCLAPIYVKENKNPNCLKGRGIFNVSDTLFDNGELIQNNPVTASSGVSETNQFYCGYFGTDGFVKAESDPYSKKQNGAVHILLLQDPIIPPSKTKIGAFASLNSLEAVLVELGIKDPFKLNSIFVKEEVTSGYEHETCILRFGDQREITNTFLDYSTQLLDVAEKRIKAKESLSIYGPMKKNDIFDLAFYLQNHSTVCLFPDLKSKSDDLKLRAKVLEGANSSPNQLERARVITFKHDRNIYPGVASWNEYLGLVEEKKKELGI